MERPATAMRVNVAHTYLIPPTSGPNPGGVPRITDSLLPPYDYKYGWSFFAAGAAFIMAELAALLSMSAYLRRFPTVDDMVRVMVPGAERKLREHQHLSSDYLIKHAGHSSLPHCSSKCPLSAGTYQGARSSYDHMPPTGICTVNNRKCDTIKDLDGCDGPLLLNKTTPDICTSNNETSGYSSEKVDSLHVTSSVVIPGLIEQDFTGPLNQTFQGVTTTTLTTATSPIPPLVAQNQTFAGQTVPIKINKNQKASSNHCHQPSFCYTDHMSRYGTLPSGGGAHHSSHTPSLGVCDLGGSSSSTSSSYCSKSKTLQHPSKSNKKSVTIGTFSTMDTAFPLDKRTNTIGYSGSAV